MLPCSCSPWWIAPSDQLHIAPCIRHSCMGQNVSAILLGIRGVDTLRYRNDDDFLWDDALGYCNPDRPVVSTCGEVIGFVVAVAGCERDGEGDLSSLVLSLGHAEAEVWKAFPEAVTKARARWEQLAKLLAAQGITMESPMLLLTQIDRG